MSTRTRDDTEQFLAELEAQRADDAAAIARAKKAATAVGKEPFDLDRFDKLMHPPSAGTRDEQIAGV